MLWKPVVYQSEDRTIEQNTLMHVYDIKNNITLNETIDQGIFYSILRQPTVSAFNISLGQANDGREAIHFSRLISFSFIDIF